MSVALRYEHDPSQTEEAPTGLKLPYNFRQDETIWAHSYLIHHCTNLFTSYSESSRADSLIQDHPRMININLSSEIRYLYILNLSKYR